MNDRVVGSISFEIRATRAQMKRDLEEAKRDLKQATGQMEADANQAAGGIGRGFGAVAKSVGLGITALIGVLTTGVALALNFSGATLRMADDMANAARRIGVSTDALQTWRFVAQKAGGAAADADKAIGAFSLKLAQATAGASKEAVKAFNLLRIGPDQLKSFKSTEEALDFVTDAIKGLKLEADRVAVAEALGLGSLSPALRDAAVDVSALRDEAMRLGVVMDAEMIRRASQAQGEFEDLSSIINVQLRGAFVDLAPALLTAINLIAQLAASLADALDQWRDLDTKTSRGIRRFDQQQSEEQKALIDRYGSPNAMRGQIVRVRPVAGAEYTPLTAGQNARVLVGGAPNLPSAQRDPALNFWENIGRNSSNLVNTPQYVDAAEHFAALNRSRTAAGNELLDRAERSRPPLRSDLPSGGTLALPPARSSNDHSAQAEARRAERVEQEIYRARQRLLGVVDDELQTVQQRFDTSQSILAIEREAEKKELESRLARKDITDEEFKRLDSLRRQTTIQEDRVAQDILARDLADERLANERLIGDLTRDLLTLQSGAARTAAERRQIELKLLEQAQDRARKELLNSTAYRKAKPEDQQAAIAAQDQAFGYQVDGVVRSTMSPLEAWRDASLSTAEQISEAYEGVAANGLDALNSGIVDAIMGTRTLGEVFSSVAKQIIADLVSIGVRQSITEPLANMLFGNGGGAPSGVASAGKDAGGWITKVLGIGKRFLGFDRGGYTGDGGRLEPAGIVHRGEYVINADATKRFLPFLEAMNAGLKMPGYSMGGLVGSSILTPDGDGSIVTVAAPAGMTI